MAGVLEQIRALKRERNAVILAHTYQPGDVQDAADYVGDSYGLSVEATRADAEVIVFCGVMFMAETAAILNPRKRVIIAEPEAGCPMAEMIEPQDLVALREQYPGHMVMCYVNSTAAIKALSDVCCTSSNAVVIAGRLPSDRGIIFVPDEHLGDHVREQTGREMVLWKGFCPTHARIDEQMIAEAREAHPGAVIMIHPEAPRACRHLADQVLSTGGMCTFAAQDTHVEYVVATETGLVYTLRKRNPGKRFFPLNERITCPNMRIGTVHSVLRALEGTGGEHVVVPEEVAQKAEGALRMMLELSQP